MINKTNPTRAWRIHSRRNTQLIRQLITLTPYLQQRTTPLQQLAITYAHPLANITTAMLQALLHLRLHINQLPVAN